MTHIVTEQGIAYLDRCDELETRMKAIAAVAGDTSVGATVDDTTVIKLRKAGLVKTAEDLKINPKKADRSLLAAQTLDDLVKISSGLYNIPDAFKK